MNNKSVSISTADQKTTPHLENQSYVSTAGIRVETRNGESYLNLEDLESAIIAECGRMAAETRPIVKAAQDARKIVDELVRGMGGDCEQFQERIKIYLQDIRHSRMAIVTETSQMTAPLREVRQFFLGADYKEEVARLKEFVDLCERLQKLKESGFLDNVADTMLRLAVKQ